MHRQAIFRLVIVTLAGAHASPARAATVWNEAIEGDLSSNGLTPTPVAMSVGSNRVLGTTGDSGSGIDRDYFRFTVPTGATLTSILLLENTTVSGGASFIGIQAGAQVTVSPLGAGAEDLIALGHYGNDQIGTDLLPVIRIGSPVTLPAGTYSVWVQDTGGPASYGFDFQLTGGGASVPALSVGGLSALAVLLALVARLSWPRPRRRARNC
jgi:hypothetical protein